MSLKLYAPPDQPAESVAGIIARAKTDPGASFEEKSLELLSRLEQNDPAEFERARAALKAAGVSVTRLRKLLDKRAVPRPRPTPTEPEPEFDPRALERDARHIIESDDVLELFMKDWRKVIAGEEKNARMLYLVGTSRLLGKTMHAAIKGPSSGGKSEIRGHVLNFFSPESIISFTALSEKALLYMQESFEHKILSMGEAQDPREQKFQDYLLRELMSEGKLRYSVAQMIGEEIVTVMIEKDGPVVFMVTTTKLKLHPENETRMLSLDVDDSEAQTRSVLNKVAEVEGLGMPATVVDYAPWHAFQRWLEMGERRVVVPFADVLSENIPPRAVRLRRDFGQVLRAIKAHALIHREHRARDESGQIVADIENDYAAVHGLMHDLLAETSEAKIKEISLETRDAVAALTKGLASDQGVTAAAVGRYMKLDKSATSRRLWGAENDGLVVNLEQRKGRHGKYRPTDEQSFETVQMLPTPDELKCIFSDPSESPATLESLEITPNKSTTSKSHGACNHNATPQPNRQKGCPVARWLQYPMHPLTPMKSQVKIERFYGCTRIWKIRNKIIFPTRTTTSSASPS